MFRILITFAFLSVVIHFAIATVRSMTGKQNWALTKSIAYSIMIATLAMSVMFGFVILF